MSWGIWLELDGQSSPSNPDIAIQTQTISTWARLVQEDDHFVRHLVKLLESTLTEKHCQLSSTSGCDLSLLSQLKLWKVDCIEAFSHPKFLSNLFYKILWTWYSTIILEPWCALGNSTDIQIGSTNVCTTSASWHQRASTGSAGLKHCFGQKLWRQFCALAMLYFSTYISLWKLFSALSHWVDKCGD